MTTERIPPAEATVEIEVPGDLYIGLNVVRKHVVEFFYRANTQGLLGADETPLAIFDCVLLEPSGRRLGGLTLHDYVVLTDQHIITWGRGLNRDIVDKFEWNNIVLDKFGRRTPIEGVIKMAYNTKVVGQKRRITIKGSHNGNGHDTIAENPETAAAQAILKGVVLYLDLMPIGDVRACASMMHYLIKNAGAPGSIAGFKEQFGNDLTRSQRRAAHVSTVLRPFYMDLGNGLLVEADTVKELRTVRTSPYRGPTSPYRSPEVRVNRGIASAGLNKGNRLTDTTGRGVTRDGDTNAPGDTQAGTGSVKETVRLNSGPIDRASKLDDYERRVTGRSTGPARSAAAPPSRLQPPAVPVSSGATPPPVAAVPASRPAPVPAMRSAAAASASRATSAEVRSAPTARAASIPPAGRPPRSQRRVASAGEVLNEANPNPTGAGYTGLDRAVTMPIGVAIPKELLNVYSLSRLARGLWIDPRNLVRNLSDISQTAESVREIADVVSTDEDARTIAVSRVRASAYSLFRDNLILHYTVWPFVKPVLDLVLLPVEADVSTGRRSRLRVRTAEGTDIEVGNTGLSDMGAMTAEDMSKTGSTVVPSATRMRVETELPPTAPAVSVTPPVAEMKVPAPPPPTPQAKVEIQPPALSVAEIKLPEPLTTKTELDLITPEGAPLNISGKSRLDPMAGNSTVPEKDLPPSKLGDDFGGDKGDDSGPKKIGFKS